MTTRKSTVAGVPRGAATRGKVAQAMAGAEAIEFKATVADRQVDGALRRFDLNTRNDEERFIYFFDTPGLELLAAGIITRARRVIGDEHDSTIKFRPVDPRKVDARWRKYRGFKIEVDASETGMVRSASFSMPVAKGLIKRVAAGEKGIAALFSAEQEAFLMEMAGRRVDFKSLAVLGPLAAQRWQFQTRECPLPITAELWRREDGARLLEVSIKAPAAQAAYTIGGFMALLAEVGADHDDQQQSKTRWALEHDVAKLAPSATAEAGHATSKPLAAQARAATVHTPGAARSAAAKTRRAGTS